jgi:FK506-binding protein 1
MLAARARSDECCGDVAVTIVHVGGKRRRSRTVSAVFGRPSERTLTAVQLNVVIFHPPPPPATRTRHRSLGSAGQQALTQMVESKLEVMFSAGKPQDHFVYVDGTKPDLGMLESLMQSEPPAPVAGTPVADEDRIKTLTVTTLPGGEGDGTSYPKNGDELTVHYTGSLAADGTQFDSSHDRGEPIKFKVGGGMVIKGWDQGFLKLSKGEKAKIEIPADLGYGAGGAGGVIPKDADLVFEVELIAIN